MVVTVYRDHTMGGGSRAEKVLSSLLAQACELLQELLHAFLELTPIPGGREACKNLKSQGISVLLSGRAQFSARAHRRSLMVLSKRGQGKWSPGP